MGLNFESIASMRSVQLAAMVMGGLELRWRPYAANDKFSQ